jgi:hypothetical protein
MAWRELTKTWHDTDVEYYDVCGDLLIQGLWVFDGGDGQTVPACREDDERLYAKLRSYDARIGEARRRYEAREAVGQD